MFNSTLMDFDLGLFGNSALDTPVASCISNNNAEAAKTLAQHMEEDKRLALTSFDDTNTSWLESTSDLQAFMDLGELPEVNDKDALINEVEEFLRQHETPSGQDVLLGTTTGTDEKLDEAEMAAAEKLLDELLKSADVDDLLFDSLEVPLEEEQPPVPTLIKETEIKIESQDDSGYFDMSNVSEIITSDGRQIIIMIAPPSPASTTDDESLDNVIRAPESVATVASTEEDPEWSPESPRTPKGRPPVKRTQKKSTARKTPYISDKKERKKQQNVEAARRYRDKKKAEQNGVETEEQILFKRNQVLKGQMAELEAELKTMKKLMLELGILKRQS